MVEKTLWQHWTEKKDEEKVEVKIDIYNELGYQPGQIVSLDILDYRGKDFPLQKIVEYSWRIEAEEYKSTDYYLDEDLKLRACDKKCWLLCDFDSFGFEQGFLHVVQEAVGSSFTLDDENASFSYVSTGRYRATTHEHKQEWITQWTFGRTAKDEANQNFEEMLFIELNEDSGWFTLWRGHEVDVSHIIVM